MILFSSLSGATGSGKEGGLVDLAYENNCRAINKILIVETLDNLEIPLKHPLLLDFFKQLLLLDVKCLPPLNFSSF